MRKIIFFIVAFLPEILMAHQSNSVSPEELISTALAQVASNDVDHVTIFCMPESVETYIPVTGTALERQYWSSITIRVFPVTTFGHNMISTLLHSSMKPMTNAPENFRWGCIFYDRNGQRLLSVYLSTYKVARINDIDVATDDKFLNFLRRQFKYLTDNWK